MPFEIVVNTLRSVRGIAPKLFRVIARDAMGVMKGSSSLFQSKPLLLYVKDQLANGALGLARIQALEKCFANKEAITGFHVLTNALDSKSLHVLTGAIDAFPNGTHVDKVVQILAGLKPENFVEIAKGSPTEIAEWSAGLAKLLNLVPVGRAKALDVAQFKRVFDNPHVFRHPNPDMPASTYSQFDLLQDLSQVSKVTDGDGVMRLVKSLKLTRYQASGCRYALSVVADLVKTEGATAVQFVNKYAGRRGRTDLDVICTLNGMAKIIEIKSSLKAFGSLRDHENWLRRITAGWGLGPMPKIQYHSPPNLPIPDWLKQLDETQGTTINHVPSIIHK